MALKTLMPDLRIVLDPDCVVRQAITANNISNEIVSQWVGNSWAGTVDGIEPAALADLVLDSRKEGVSPIFHLLQNFPSGLQAQFEYLIFCRDNGRDFVAIGRNLQPSADRHPGHCSHCATTNDSLPIIESLTGVTGRLGEASMKEVVSSAVGLVERYYVEAALKAVDGNRTAAARLLGISRQGFYDKLARYRIDEHSNIPGRLAKAEIKD